MSYIYKHRRYTNYRDNVDVPEAIKNYSWAPCWQQHYMNVHNSRVYSLNKVSTYTETNIDRRNSSDGYGVWFSSNCGYVNTLIPLAFYKKVNVTLMKPMNSDTALATINPETYQEGERTTRAYYGGNMYHEDELYLYIQETNNIRDMSTPDLYRAFKNADNFNTQFTSLVNISARTRCTMHAVKDNVYVMNVYRLTETEQLYNFIAVASNDFLNKQEDSEWKQVSLELVNDLYKYRDISPYFLALEHIIEGRELEVRNEVERRENLENLKKSIVDIYRTKRTQAEKTIKDYEIKLREQYTLYDEANALLSNAENKVQDKTILEQFYNDTRIKWLKIDNGTLYLDIYCPLSVYATRLVERQVQNPDSNINRSDVGNIFRALFVDEDYELYTYTSMAISLTNNRDLSRYHHCIYPDAFTHPHIDGFNCFGEYRTAIYKAVSTMSLDVLLLTCITAASNINFADGTVVSSFARNIRRRVVEESSLKCVKDKETGAMLTLFELECKLNGQEVAAE